MRLQSVLGGLAVLELTERIARVAGRLDPAAVRALDAVHVASALELGGELDAFVTYDRRQGEAALRLGLPVVAPT